MILLHAGKPAEFGTKVPVQPRNRIAFRTSTSGSGRPSRAGTRSSDARTQPWPPNTCYRHDGTVKRALPWVLLAVGLVMMVTAVVLGVRGVADAVGSTTQWTSSGTPHQVSLTQGDWALYEETVSPSPLARQVTADQIEVSSPSGPVPVTATVTNETLTINNRTYSAVGRFTAPSDGTYEIAVETVGSRMLVGRPIGSTILSTFAYVALLALGGLLTLAAIVWLIVAFIGSRSRRQPMPVAAGTTGAPPAAVAGPGQWYPDPDDPTQWRWWDGRAWTDQRAPRQP